MNVVRWALLFVLSSAFALGACPEVPSSPYECKGRVLISNKEELQSYLSDFGLNSKKTFIRAAHLTGAFVDQSEGASLHLSTPCQITVLENTTLDIKGEVCLISGKNVIARSGLNLTTGTALLKAPNKVIIQDNFNGVISGELSLISTGVTLDSRAHIRHTSNVHATKLTLSALRRATLGHTSIYNVSGKVTLSSNGENLPSDIEEGISEWSSIWRDTQLNAGSLEIDAIDQVRVSSGVNITSPSVLLNGKSCRINKNSTITSDTKSGSCFSGLMPIAKLKITPNKEAVLNQSIFFDASRSHFNEGAKFIWTSYERSSGTESIIESKTTASPLTNFSFSTLGEKRIHLKIESLEGYYAELNRKILIINSNPTPPVASLVATPIEGEVPFNITLDASASGDSDGTIVRYVFSDGTDVVESTNPTLTFIQETPGTYNYTVEVTDNDGLKSSATAQVVAKPKTTNEESALLAYYKFNLIPTGGNTFNLELIFEGRSLNGKAITKAFYSTTNGDRLDVGRAILGHIDVIPVELDSPLELSLNLKDELGGVAVYTHTINADSLNQAPLLSVDTIEYATNNMVFFSNLFHDPYGQLDGFTNFQIDFGDGITQDIQESSFQVSHAYPSAGDFLVKITAFGNNGRSFSVEETIAVSGEVNPFKFPLADFRVEKAPWAPGVRLYVDQSLSPNSPIKTYLWELGDGTTAYGREVIHFYQAGGYDVTLTAILEDGTQSVVKREIIIMNDAPNIVSDLDCWDIGNLTLECDFSAADKFNDLSQFNVHFGDSEVLPENIISQSVSGGLKSVSFIHTYQNSGNYTVSYQVISGRGEDLIKARDFSVTDAPGNLPPVADLSCFSFYDQVDCQAYGSFDPDGFITEYRFFYGNGDSEVTTTPQSFYRYSEVGTYEISLEVVDNFGTTSRVSQTVVIEERPNEFPVPNLSCVSNDINQLTCDGRGSFDTDGVIALGRITALETGEVFETTNVQNLIKTFSFPTDGVKSIKIEVLDNDSAMSEETRSFVTQTALTPQVAFSCSSTNLRELACDASNSTAGSGEIVEYLWKVEGQEYFGKVITVSGLAPSGVNVSLTLKNSFGKENTNVGYFEVLQNSPPVADFNCISASAQNLSCLAEISDPDGDQLSIVWKVGDLIINDVPSINLDLPQGGDTTVILVVNDGRFEERVSKNVLILENSAPSITLSCVSNVDFVADCSVEVLEPDNQEFTIKWFSNNTQLDQSSNSLRHYEYNVSTVIKVVVEDSLGASSMAEIEVNLKKNGLGAQVTCNQVNNYSVDCFLGLSGFQNVVPKWFVNEEPLGEGNRLNFVAPNIGTYQIKVMIESLANTYQFDKTLNLVDLPNESILSDRKLSILNPKAFYKLSDTIEFSLDGDGFLVDDFGKIKKFEIYTDSDGPDEYEILESTSNSISLITTFKNGFNNLYIESLDKNGNKIVFSTEVFAGDKDLTMTYNGNYRIRAFLEENLKKPILDFTSSSVSETILNFPRKRVFLEVGSYPNSRLFQISESQNNIDISLSTEVLDINRNSLNFSNGLSGWSQENLNFRKLSNETTFNILGVSKESVEVTQSSDGFFRLKTIVEMSNTNNFQFPFNLISQAEDSFVYYNAENTDSGNQRRGILSAKELRGGISRNLFKLQLPTSEVGDKVYIEIFGKLPISQSTVFNSFLNFFGNNSAFANDSDESLLILPVENPPVILSDLTLKDGQVHDIGKPLVTFIQGGFPPVYNQRNALGEKVYKVQLGGVGFNKPELRLFPQFLEICPLGGAQNCFVLKELYCTSENTLTGLCEIYFTEEELNYVSTPHISMRLRIGEITFPLTNNGPLQVFRILRNASYDDFLGGFNDSDDRYGFRQGSGIDDEDGGDDWYAPTHVNILRKIFREAGTSYEGNSSQIRIDDISPTGVSRRNGFGHDGHNVGITFDARFVGNEVGTENGFTQLYGGSVQKIDKYSSDARGIINILESGDGYVNRILVTNDDLGTFGNTVGYKLNRIKETTSPFLMELATSCTEDGLYPLGFIGHKDEHSTHVDVELNDISFSGSIERYQKDLSSTPPSILPSPVLLNLESKDSSFQEEMPLMVTSGFTPYSFDGTGITGKYLIAYRLRPSSLLAEYEVLYEDEFKKYSSWNFVTSNSSNGLFYLRDSLIYPNKESSLYNYYKERKIFRGNIDVKLIYLWGNESRPSCEIKEDTWLTNIGNCNKETRLNDKNIEYLSSFYPIDYGQEALELFCSNYPIPIHRYDSRFDRVEIDNGWREVIDENGVLIRTEFWLGYNSSTVVLYENSFGRTISCSSFSFPLLSQCTEVEDETERKIQGGEVFFRGLKFTR
jgi:PKD repeat protein